MLDTLPHDIKHHLLAAAATNSYGDLDALSRVSPGFSRAFYGNRSIHLKTAFPQLFELAKLSLEDNSLIDINIPATKSAINKRAAADFDEIQRFALFLNHVESLGLTWSTSLKTSGLSTMRDYRSPTVNQWIACLVDFASLRLVTEDGEVHRRMRLLRLWAPQTPLPYGITPFHILVELFERVIRNTHTKTKKFPMPALKVPGASHIAQTVINWVCEKGDWKWMGQVLGVWDGKWDPKPVRRYELVRNKEGFMAGWVKRRTSREEVFEIGVNKALLID